MMSESRLQLYDCEEGKIEKALCMFFFIFLPYHTTHNLTRSDFATRRAWSSHIIQSLTYPLARSLNWSQFQLHYFQILFTKYQWPLLTSELNFKSIEFTCGVEGKIILVLETKIFTKKSSSGRIKVFFSLNLYAAVRERARDPIVI